MAVCIAVTGGIGTGKTTLMRFFAEAGARVADADDVAHSLYLPGQTAFDAMVARWGQEILTVDGQISRPAVAARVFADSDELAWLDNLVHPLVRSEIQRLAGADGHPLFCAIPLLYESGWENDFAKVIAVWCPPEVQRRRLQARHWSEQEIARRLATQISMDEKLRRADFGVMTHCSWECLREQCRRIYQTLIAP